MHDRESRPENQGGEERSQGGAKKGPTEFARPLLPKFVPGSPRKERRNEGIVGMWKVKAIRGVHTLL